MTVDPGVLEINARRAVFEDNQLQLVVPPVGASADLGKTKKRIQRRTPVSNKKTWQEERQADIWEHKKIREVLLY